LLNKYKLYNADTVEATQSNISNESIDLVLTDPPFGVGFKNDFYNDSEEYILTNIDKWFSEWYRILKEGSYLVIFVGVKTIHTWIQKGIEAGFEYKNILATRSFNNGAPSPKNNFGFQFQPILLFSKGKGKDFNEVDFIPTSEEWFKDKRNKNPKPFTYQYPNWIKTEWSFASEKRASKNLHPNEKNVELLSFIVELLTQPNETVFDGFAGSGSTGVASLSKNRKFVGVEIDNNYYDFILKRLSKHK